MDETLPWIYRRKRERASETQKRFINGYMHDCKCTKDNVGIYVHLLMFMI
jgi:hypothetical protein